MALKRICKASGCHNLAEYPNRYCEVHKKLETPEKDTFLGGEYEAYKNNPWNELYRSYRWKEASKEFLRKNPICVRCGGRATAVDHIKPHRGDEELFWDEFNWQPLCSECHRKKTQEEITERKREQAREYQRNKRIGKLWY